MSLNLDYIRIGKLVGPHGLDGRLKVLIVSDVAGRFEGLKDIYACLNGFYKKYPVETYEPYKDKYGLIRLKNVDNRELAEELVGIDLFIKFEEAQRDRKTLDHDTYFYYELVGCKVFLKKQLFGEVVDIFEGGAGEILVIADKNNKEYLIPFVESMVNIENIKKEQIEITPVEGLLEEQKDT